MKVLFYAGAGLARHVWDELQAMAVATTGERIIFLSSLGSTETAPAALARTWESEQPGNIGVPMRGVELKLVPNGGKLEGRYKGPNITPGYWRRPDLTKEAFDDEGFYKMGDALKFEDAGDPGKGLVFDGRLAEDFKLASGTWVSAGALRAQFIDHCAPLVRDAVIAGLNRDDIAALVFPDVEACRKLAGLAADAPPAAVLADPKLRDEFKKRLNALARQSTGGSTRICRLILMAEPPSLDAGEATDKGSINQRAVLTRRAALVEELYAGHRHPTQRDRHRPNGNRTSMDPKGHAAIVTGAASGLGAETAAHLATAGVKVACLDINLDGAKETAGKIGGIAIRCDVTSSDNAEAALKEARDKHGPARILVNCAGVGPAKRMVGRDGPMPLAEFEKVIAVNLTGTFNMMRLVAADMQNVSAARRRRARRDRLDRVGRRLRGPDRPGALRRVQGRRRGADHSGGARAVAVRHPRHGDRAGHLRHADAARAAAGGAGLARRFGAVPQAPRRAARIRRSRAVHHPQQSISTAR